MGLALRAWSLRLDPQRMTTERCKTAQPAGEHDDLLVPARPVQRVEHELDAVVIAIDQSVVEDDRDDPSALGQHGTHGQSDEDGNLLLRAVRQPVERFGAAPLDAADGKVIAKLKLGSWEEVVEERTQMPADWLIITIAAFRHAARNDITQ